VEGKSCVPPCNTSWALQGSDLASGLLVATAKQLSQEHRYIQDIKGQVGSQQTM